jgi:hypothetical protein
LLLKRAYAGYVAAPAFESRVPYDAERAAQTVATPESVFAGFELMVRRLFRKSGYRLFDRNTRRFF